MNAKIVLVPTDFSSHAAAALDCAAQLAKSLDATLTIVHVELAPVLTAPYDDEDDPSGMQAHHLLEQIKPGDPRVNFQRVLLRGNVAEGLLKFAAERHADLIVMGTHGQTNSPAAALGTIAEEVTKKAACTVVTVRPASSGSPSR